MSTVSIKDVEGDYLYVKRSEAAITLSAPFDDVTEFCFEIDSPEFNTLMRTLSGGTTTDADWRIDLISLAIRHDMRVKFAYAKGAGKPIESRELKPLKIEQYKGETVITGTDPYRDDEYRAYRLDRIKGPVTLV